MGVQFDKVQPDVHLHLVKLADQFDKVQLVAHLHLVKLDDQFDKVQPDVHLHLVKLDAHLQYCKWAPTYTLRYCKWASTYTLCKWLPHTNSCNNIPKSKITMASI